MSAPPQERECNVFIAAQCIAGPKPSASKLAQTLEILEIDSSASSVTGNVYPQMKIAGKRALRNARTPNFATDLPKGEIGSLGQLTGSIKQVAEHVLAIGTIATNPSPQTIEAQDKVISGLKASFLRSTFCGPCAYASICPTNTGLRNKQSAGQTKLEELEKLPLVLLGEQISTGFIATSRNNVSLNKGYKSFQDTKFAEQNSSTRSKIVDTLTRIDGPFRNNAIIQALKNLGESLDDPRVLEEWEGFLKGIAIEVYVFRALQEAYGKDAVRKTSTHQDVHEHTDFLLKLDGRQIRIDAKSRSKFIDHTFEYDSQVVNESAVRIIRSIQGVDTEDIDILVITPTVRQKRRKNLYYDERINVQIGNRERHIYDLGVPISEHFLELLRDAISKFHPSNKATQ